MDPMQAVSAVHLCVCGSALLENGTLTHSHDLATAAPDWDASASPPSPSPLPLDPQFLCLSLEAWAEHTHTPGLHSHPLSVILPRLLPATPNPLPTHLDVADKVPLLVLWRQAQLETRKVQGLMYIYV